MIDLEKIDRLVEILKQHDIDGYLMGPNFDLKYLTGIDPFPDERFKGLLVMKSGEIGFVSPELYYEDFRQSLGEDCPIYIWSDNDGVNDTFKKLKQDYALENKIIGIDDSIRGIDLLDMIDIIGAKFVNEPKISRDLRVCKNKEEIELLQRAAKIADETFQQLIKFIKPGIKEADISAKIKETLYELGGESLSFEPIVASGPNSSMPHYSGDQRVIEEQDIIVLDYGCIYKGYCSDISRTVFIGEPTDEQRKVYDIVYESNKKAEAAVREGVSAGEIDKIARSVIEDAGYGKYFINRTGHGIGIEVHEEPYIRSNNEYLLKNGMAFSIEPGIYIPGKFGMRIENIVVVNDDQPLVLNKATEDIISI